MTVLCQWCGAANSNDRELCARCNERLIVVSGATGEDVPESLLDEGDLNGTGTPLDEHLLERVTATEDAIRRMRLTISKVEDRVTDLERGLSLLDAGVQALVELLDRRKVIRENELITAWERAASTEMAREELLDRLREHRESIMHRSRSAGEPSVALTARALQSAELALLAGQPLRASEILAAELRRFPRNADLAALLGELSFDRGDMAEAEHYFRQAIRWNETDVGSLIYLGTLLADAGRQRDAQEQLERALALAPESFLTHFSLGAFHAAAGRLAEARQYLEAAARREHLPQVLFLLGMVELDSGRAGAAADALEQAVELDAEFEDAIYYLGLAYLERGWNRKALDCFRRVLEIDPQRLQYQEAVRLVEGGASRTPPLPPGIEVLVQEASGATGGAEVERALGRLQRAARSVDDPSLLASLALLAAAAGHHRQALAAAHRLLRLGVQGTQVLAAWTALLETLRATRRYHSVRYWGRRLFNDGPGTLERGVAAYELALTELESGGDATRALELAHASLDLVPRELRQYPLAALGRIHLERKEYTDAVDYLEQAAALSEAPAILTQLGLALLEAGDKDRAKAYLLKGRTGAAKDLKTDVLTHLAKVTQLAGHRRRRG